MRHSLTHSTRPDARAGRLRSQQAHSRSMRAIRFTLAMAFMLLLPGCVTSSKFGEVETERDELALDKAALEKQVAGLEVANRSLESERVEIFDELEDRREETEMLTSVRSDLENDLNRLSQTEEELSEKLSRQQAELESAKQEVAALQSTYQDLVDDLEAELQQGAVEIEQLRSGLRVVVADEILFASGSAELGRQGDELLSKVAANIKKLDYMVDVEGHTDSKKIRGTLKKRIPATGNSPAPVLPAS
jgi:chemotaxis protein MotB